MTEAEIRAAHPDWTDEQVAAEVARLAEKPDPPKPAKPEPETDPAKLAQAEVDKAYEKLRESEKARAKLEKEAKERADADLSETERLKQENEENRARAEAATVNAQSANLLAALAEKGLVGGKANAAARLLDSVEYDDAGKPTNLDAALEAAKAAYGEATFTPDVTPRPPAPNLNAGPGNEPGPEPNLTAEELEWASKSGMAPEKYEEMKGVKTYEDWQAAQRRLAAQQQ